MYRAVAAFLVGVVALCGGTAPCAQETPAVVEAPISPADFLKDKKKAPECQRLGDLYARGKDVPQDEARAVDFYDAACRSGLVGSCAVQGWLLLERHQRPEDVKLGEELLDRACKTGAPSACDMLGRVYANGLGVAQDVPKARKVLGDACERNFAQPCATLAHLLDAGVGKPRDPELAQKAMEKACLLGTDDVCSWACDQGSATACHAAGVRAAEEVRAVQFYEKSCSLQETPDCAVVASAYYLGQGVQADLGTAVLLYARACEALAVPVECIILGGIYARGEMGDAERAKATRYLTRACQGDAACLAALADDKIPARGAGHWRRCALAADQ
jgi:uncharacterized protein